MGKIVTQTEIQALFDRIALAKGQGLAIIQDNDISLPTLSISDVSLNEATSGQLTFKPGETSKPLSKDSC